MFLKLKAAVAALSLAASGALAGDLVINFDDLNPGPKKGFDDAVAQFKAENPDINVIVNNNDREAHKTAIRNFLTADAPDVTSWYPGNRMAPFVDAGLFESIDDVWAENGFNEDLPRLRRPCHAMAKSGVCRTAITSGASITAKTSLTC